MKRRRTYSSRIPDDRRQTLGQKGLGVLQLRRERRSLNPAASGAVLVFHQDLAVFPGFHQLVVGKVVDVPDVV